MEISFKDKIVAITGAASGIGKRTAEMFASAGATVAALDFNLEGCQSAAQAICAAGGKAEAFRIDVSDEKSIDDCFAAVMDKFGRLDVLVNCAGISTYDNIEAQDGKSFDRVMGIDIRGTFLCCRNAYKIMSKQRSGNIVNISSTAAKVGGINVSTGYVVAKGGVISLTFHFAKNLAPFGVRVNCICPGAIDTPMLAEQERLPGKSDARENVRKTVPLGTLGQPDDIANGIMFLADDVRARYITGEILDINGGALMD